MKTLIICNHAELLTVEAGRTTRTYVVIEPDDVETNIELEQSEIDQLYALAESQLGLPQSKDSTYTI